MLPLLAALALCVPPRAQDDPPAPDKKQVEATLHDLEESVRARDPKARVAALERAGGVADAQVVERIAHALGEPEKEVVLAAIEALRWQRHPSAVEALHKAYETRRELRKDGELAAALLKAIGQHADPRSIRFFVGEPFEAPNDPALQARILGLGRIRSVDAIQALIDLLKSSQPKNVDPYMNDFRLALAVLTGTDQGPTPTYWIRWWNDHRKDFVVPVELPELPRPMLERWYGYWKLEAPWGRGKRREDRGQDEPGSRGRDSG